MDEAKIQVPKKLLPKEKVLRSDLQKRKTALEKKGWKILNNEVGWYALKGAEERRGFARLEDLLTFAEISETVKSKSGESADRVHRIKLSRIAPCRFEPQQRRREKFLKEDIKKLAASIKTHRLRQPILIRPVKPLDSFKAEYEIVFGERRFLAVKQNGGNEIACFIEDLSDAEVVELQYEENTRRQENSPLDDAFLFKFLMREQGYTIAKLADRFAASEKSIAQKLKLNDLIPEAVSEFSDGFLPYRHALYLSRFSPAVQREIVDKGLPYHSGGREDGALAYYEFKNEIEEIIIRRLRDAPFDPEDERLHLKNLKCSKCVENTIFAPMLFADSLADARCLNRDCFEFKTNVHLRLKREEIALKSSIVNRESTIEERAKQVPLVTNSNHADKSASPFSEKILTNQTLLEKPECEFSVLSLVVGGEKKGESAYICQNESCDFHHPKAVIDAEQMSEGELDRIARSFNKKVSEAVRFEVLSAAIKTFDSSKVFWQFDDLIKRLLTEFWFSRGFDVLKIISGICAGWVNLPSDNFDQKQVEEFIDSLDKRRQSQLLFLLTWITEGYYHTSTQDGVRKLAGDWTKIDYDALCDEKRILLGEVL